MLPGVPVTVMVTVEPIALTTDVWPSRVRSDAAASGAVAHSTEPARANERMVAFKAAGPPRSKTPPSLAELPDSNRRHEFGPFRDQRRALLPGATA